MLEDSASAIPSSIWASMNSWFTPTVLFLLLNLMIATIAFTSSFSNQKQQQKHPNTNSPIARSPSLLQRLKSINLSASPPPPLQDPSLHHKQTPDSDTLFTAHHSHAHTPNLDAQAAHYFFPPHSPQETAAAAHEPQDHFVSGRVIPTHFDFEQKDSIFDGFEGAHEEKIEENDDRSLDEVYSNFIRTKSDTKPTAGEIPAKLPAKMRKSASLKSAFAHFEEGDIVEARRPATVREAETAAAADDGVDAKADDFINRFKQQLKLQRLDSIIRYKDMIGRGR